MPQSVAWRATGLTLPLIPPYAVSMTITLLFALLSPAAHASSLTQIDANCWNKAVDADGSFLCQYLMIGGKEEGSPSYSYPELRAPDGSGPKTFQQATLACELLGFRYATNFTLAKPAKELTQVTLSQSGAADLSLSVEPFVQHLNCAD